MRWAPFDERGSTRPRWSDRRALAPRPSGRLLRRTDALLLDARVFDDRSLGSCGFSDRRSKRRGAPSLLIIDGSSFGTGDLCLVEALARRVPVTVRMPRFLAGTTELTRAPDTLLSWLEGRWQPLSDAPISSSSR